MISLSKKDFQEKINDKKCIVFFHKHGCPNCEAMTPLMEELEKNNPDIKIYSYLCERDEETKKFDENVSKFQFRSFPLIVCYSEGKTLFARSEVFVPENLSIVFLPRSTLQNDFFSTEVMLNQKMQSHKMEVKAIRDENMIRTIVIQNLIAIENGVDINADNWELPTERTIKEGEQVPCDGCQ